MKGTEKQFAWATELRDKVIKTFNDSIPALTKAAPSPEAFTKAMDTLNSRIAALTDENVYAGDIISLFKDVQFTGHWDHDLAAINSVYRIHVPETTGQHVLLGR